MGNIKVGRYSPGCKATDSEGNWVPLTYFWQGWIEPEDESWIMFIHADGSPTVYLNRDPVTGAVI